MKPFLCRGMVAWLCVSFSGMAAGEEAPDGLLFHASFDDGAGAVVSAGKAEPETSRGVEFGPGICGGAVRIAGDALLAYTAEKNLSRAAGTVSFWFQPEWDADPGRGRWHTLFAQPFGPDRVGSGALWFWFYGHNLRGDVADPNDSYIQTPVPARKEVWHHLAFTWEGHGGSAHRMYFDGREVGGRGDSHSPLKPGSFSESGEFARFFIGAHSEGGGNRAEGWFDEFRIYDRALTASEVAAEAARVVPLRVTMPRRVFRKGDAVEARIRVENVGMEAAEAPLTLRVKTEAGEVGRREVQLDVKPGETVRVSERLPTETEGRIVVELVGEDEVRTGLLREEAWVLGDNSLTAPTGAMRTTRVDTVDVVERFRTGEGFASVGAVRVGELNGETFLEAGEEINDRFAVRIELPDARGPYLLEMSYPDDRKRTMDIVAQSSDVANGEYMLQTGVFTGDAYRTGGEMNTFRCLLWPRDRDTTLIFMTARGGAPAAVGRIRVKKVEGGLPAADIQTADPVEGWTRTVGLYYEDPALPLSFGRESGLMPGFFETVKELTAYMKWSGQNMLLYPLVWYQGGIGEAYNPRGHSDVFAEVLLSEFEREGLEMMATVNLHNIPWSGSYQDKDLHDSPVMILDTGKPNPGGWHGTSPNFNPLHPETQAFILARLDAILDRCADSPSFKGVVLHLTRHTPIWFGNPDAGYNDYMIERFTADTGIEVPVSRTAEDRGRLYAEWLRVHASEAWFDWRCRELADFHHDLADRLSSRRSDLKLGLFSYAPALSEMNDPRFVQPEYNRIINHEAGLDPALYADMDNVILAQTQYPADYRWSVGRHAEERFPDARASLRDRQLRAGAYALTADARFPWTNLHDRYFESAVGRIPEGEHHWSLGGDAKPLNAPWLDEVDWRVSTLNPAGRAFLRSYLVPLIHQDVLGFSKGGFLIGTHGVESPLREFAKAYRALPALRFEDVESVSDALTVRRLHHDGATWVYVVNAFPEPKVIGLAFPGAGDGLSDLAGRPVGSIVAGRLRLELKPYDFRAFRIPGDRQVVPVAP